MFLILKNISKFYVTPDLNDFQEKKKKNLVILGTDSAFKG